MLTVCSFLKCDVSFFTLCAKMSLWEFLSWDGELKLTVTTVPLNGNFYERGVRYHTYHNI